MLLFSRLSGRGWYILCSLSIKPLCLGHTSEHTILYAWISILCICPSLLALSRARLQLNSLLTSEWADRAPLVSLEDIYHLQRSFHIYNIQGACLMISNLHLGF